MSCFFARVLAVATSEVIDSALVSVSVLVLVFVIFNVLFKDDFLALTLAWPDARDHISLVSCIWYRVSLNEFLIDSSPAIPFPSLSLLGRVTFTCLVNTVIFSW